ncbi:MAG TPA: thiopeptide-type bacteriocin biosynthesis protein, partial [Thermoanaerobaculia bacterium]|nr:thiopeptide-type bacteriocin biosynthesis protein [Thermoanaerobaculia bacterium]
ERLGNVICRPVLRDYEIPYLGRSGAPAERQLDVSDLLVSVVDGRVTLRSARLDRQVIPRLTNAHAYMYETHLPTYRFLSALQEQGYCAMNGGWLEELNDRAPMPFLPRVRVGRVVLSRARWTLGAEEIGAFAPAKGAKQFASLQELRARRRLPRWIQLDEMLFDLDNPLSVETLAGRLSGRTTAKVRELFPSPDELLARGPEGRFVHELIVPFLRKREATKGERLPPRAPVAPEVRLYPPGSEWLYAKIYTGLSFADSILTDLIRSLAESQLASGAIDRWFFVRFRDGREHLRVRFHGSAERLLSEVLPALRDALTPHLHRGSVTGFQLDSYDREVERYGGPDGIDTVERLFMRDSEAVIELLELCRDDEEMRWRIAAIGAEMLMHDLGLDLPRRRAVLEHLQQHFDGKMAVDAPARRQIAERYRREAKSLELLLTTTGDPAHPLADAVEVLRRRSERIAPYVVELSRLRDEGRLIFPLDALAASCVHMFMYRLLLVEQNAQETVLYHFLSRVYDSMAARAKAAPA